MESKSQRRQHFAPLVTALGSFTLLSSVSANDEAFFESKIRPILVEHCYECHSLEAKKAKGGLRVDSREALRTGGDTGPAVVPGKPGKSLLLTAIRHDDPDFEMPPKKAKLPDGVAADFETWIASGAFDPREDQPGAGHSDDLDRKARLEHWSYRPIRAHDPPDAISDWPLTAIDRFVLARLEEENFAPSPDADPVTFLRRLHFDLVGLPPTPEQVEAFSWDRLEETVDELLASPGFGVRWGRHWLDVVRFAESNGRESNIVYPHAWRYRDYVIDAVTEDLPYDRFLLEQVAGDLLSHENETERARLLVATGFLAIGPKGLNLQDHEQFAADVVDEQLDALSRGFLASSLACARCHDHKSDPVSMEDYYALIGIFKSSKTYYGTWVDSENNNGGDLIALPDLPGQLKPGHPIPKEKVAQMKQQLAELEEKERAGKAMAKKLEKEGKKAMAMRENFNEMLREALRVYWTRGRLVGKLATVDDQGIPLPLCMGVLEAETPVDSPVYLRGDLKNPADMVPRGVPALFGMDPVPPTGDNRSGRLALGHWLSRPDHPLTARVMANRAWSHLFGSGLVHTTDNFGRTGATPSHPELLDYLAKRFRENGWSLKQLVRGIVLSRTYRQSSDHSPGAFRRDPDNRLLWRMSPRRLDAEVIRDSMLFVSGQLDRSPRPASLAAELKSHSVSLVGFDKAVPADLDGSLHRSAYLPVFRENLPDVLELFDFAEPSLVVGNRDETNVPPQALYLMNSPFVRERSVALGRRLANAYPDRDARIDAAFEICFQRSPDEHERKLVATFLEESGDTPNISDSAIEPLARFCQALLSSAEFRFPE